MTLHISGLPLASLGQSPAVGARSERELTGGFAKIMGDALAETASALKAAEDTSAAAMVGKASVQEVVEKVMNAERQLQTILAIRDKVVAAYQELNRSTI